MKCGKIIYPFPNFNGCTISDKIMDVITFPCCDLKLNHFRKGGPWWLIGIDSICHPVLIIKSIKTLSPGNVEDSIKHIEAEREWLPFCRRHFLIISLNESYISSQISLKCVPMSPSTDKTALIQVMAWYRKCPKHLLQSLMTLFTDACAIGSQNH